MRRTPHRSHPERQGPEPGFIAALVFGHEMLLGLFHVNVADKVLHLVVGAAAYLGFAPQFGGRRISPTHWSPTVGVVAGV